MPEGGATLAHILCEAMGKVGDGGMHNKAPPRLPGDYYECRVATYGLRRLQGAWGFFCEDKTVSAGERSHEQTDQTSPRGDSIRLHARTIERDRRIA